jgi:hypothetical protein
MKSIKKSLFLAVILLVMISMVLLSSVSALSVTQGTKVSRVTGATPAGETLPNPNQTKANYAVWGTDLGIMWDKGGGEMFVAFGDTFGEGWVSGGGGGDWRSNVLAKSSDTNLSDGLSFSMMFTDSPGHAKEILWSKKIDNDEITVIPTAGVTVGSRHYIHYMSVHHWGDPGVWFTNYSGMAYSDDGGSTWTKHGTARWYNDSSWSSKFQMAAFIKNGGYVYMYSTPNGRFGDVYLSRVPESLMLDINAYRYWDGAGWSASQSAARPVAVGVAGEMSIAYNTNFKRFILMYLNEHRNAIVMRDSPTLTGPWNGEKIVATASTYPGIYGSYIHPWGNNGTDLYWVTSQWDPYNSFLMKSTLSVGSDGNNIVSEPGFETQAATTIMAPWYLEGNGGIDRNIGQAHTGQDNGYVRYNTGWNALKQRFAVQPYTWYTMKGWVRTSSNMNNGYFGARVPNNGPIMAETHLTSPLTNYTQISVNFNTGANSFAEIYSGIWADGDTWMQLDDVSVVKGANLVGQPGFDAQPTDSLTSPWYGQGNTGVDRNLGFAHSGQNNAWARNTTGWNAIKQEVFVEPNTSYTLSAWLRTSGNQNNGYFGARVMNGGPILNEIHLTSPLTNYTLKTVTFNSGNNHSVEIFAGTWADGDTWIRADTFSMTKN